MVLPHEALRIHSADLLTLAARYGFTDVRVFGSVARGTDRPDSDLDLLVKRPEGAGLLTVARFAEEAAELLGVEVDVVTDGGLDPDHTVMRTAVPVAA